MGDESRFDRRAFVRSAGATIAGVLGVTGRVASTVGDSNAGSAGGRESTADEAATESGTRTGQTTEPGTRTGQTTDPGGGVRRFRMVLPAVEPLETTYVNVAVVVGGQVRPGVRPPPRCLPETEGRWLAYDAAVVDLTESPLLGGDGDEVATVVRTRAYAARDPRRNTPYRIVDGTDCDGYVRATVHELADEFEIAVEASD